MKIVIPYPREVSDYSIRYFRRDTSPARSLKKIHHLVLQHVVVIVEYRISFDFRMLIKPSLNFVTTGQAEIMEYGCYVETADYLLFNNLAPVAQASPRGGEDDFQVRNSDGYSADDESEVRVDQTTVAPYARGGIDYAIYVEK